MSQHDHNGWVGASQTWAQIGVGEFAVVLHEWAFHCGPDRYHIKVVLPQGTLLQVVSAVNVEFRTLDGALITVPPSTDLRIRRATPLETLSTSAR